MNRTILCVLILGTVLTGLSQPGSAQSPTSPPDSSNATPPYAHPIGFHDRTKRRPTTDRRATPDATTDRRATATSDRRATPEVIADRRVAAAADDEVDEGPNPFRYMIGGALVGALATGVVFAIALSDDDFECLCPIHYVVVSGVVVGAGVGAGVGGVLGLLGLLVNSWRKETWVDHPF